MSSCSSSTSAAQPSIQQLIQKETSPTPQQANNATLTNAIDASGKNQATDALNTSGSRGTTVNIKS